MSVYNESFLMTVNDRSRFHSIPFPLIYYGYTFVICFVIHIVNRGEASKVEETTEVEEKEDGVVFKCAVVFLIVSVVLFFYAVLKLPHLSGVDSLLYILALIILIFIQIPIYVSVDCVRFTHWSYVRLVSTVLMGLYCLYCLRVAFVTGRLY